MIHLSLDYRNDSECRAPSEYLRRHRTMRGFSTRELADKIGVVPATINLYESDNRPMKHDTAVALSDVRGIGHRPRKAL
jgi:transcriptional regulator with XRE-family HTH domain